MIATTSPASQTILANQIQDDFPSRWQRLAAEAITDPAELCGLLGLDHALVPFAKVAAEKFGLRVPRGFVARMKRGDPQDPLLLQVLPIAAELQPAPGFTNDPVGDLASRAALGLLHKYRGRALLIGTGACAVHCRYCFRRHFPYSEETASADGWQAALDYVRADTSIDEVILSGGDPLNLSDRRLAELSNALEGIPHITRLRIHSRTAVVLPERIDAHFCRWLSSVRLQKIVVLHINHPNEINSDVQSACARLKACGTTLLNQSVLLMHVNDSVSVLSHLSESLFAVGVMPYYLNLLDLVAGAAHFEVSEARGVELMRELTARLPGYLVPKLVREAAGGRSKTSVSLFV
jgi:EF-P beta-lysylation protein EpmB